MPHNKQLLMLYLSVDHCLLYTGGLIAKPKRIRSSPEHSPFPPCPNHPDRPATYPLPLVCVTFLILFFMFSLRAPIMWSLVLMRRSYVCFSSFQAHSQLTTDRPINWTNPIEICQCLTRLLPSAYWVCNNSNAGTSLVLPVCTYVLRPYRDVCPSPFVLHSSFEPNSNRQKKKKTRSLTKNA